MQKTSNSQTQMSPSANVHVSRDHKIEVTSQWNK